MALHPLARDLAVLSRSAYPLIYVVTQEEDRALRMVEAAAKAVRKDYHRWSVSEGFGGAGPSDAVAALDAVAQQDTPALIVLLDFDPYLSDPAVVRRLRDRLPELVQRRQSIVVVAPVLVLPPGLEKEAAVLDMPLPRQEELAGELEKVARSEKITVDPEVAERAVRSALGLSLNEAGRVFRKVMVLRKGLGPDDLNMVVEEKKGVLRKTDVLEFHELGEGLSGVGGLNDMKRWLQARTRAFGDDARRYGLPPPKGLLLLGVQGCGKSLSAKAVAELWKFPLLRLDVGALFSSKSAPEAALREAIKISESLAPVVLWVDEIEKGFIQVEGDEAGSRVFGSFITWLAEKEAEVFVVATANDVSNLPPELMRRGRFDEVFFVDLPNPHERQAILEIHLKKRGRDPARFAALLPDLAKRAEHFSGAELEQVVISALYRAFADTRELSEEDLDLSMKQTVPLYRTYEEKIKWLRDWARTRARPATQDSSVLDLFGV
jgi:AAA+ superfamily predicted ATPase